jgi:hypothetical protein
MPDQASALSAMRVIDLVLDFYGPDGEPWLQRAFRDRRKRRCLVGAIAYVRRKHGIGGDGASWYIYEVIRPQIYEVRPAAKSLWSESLLRDRLIFYNDHRCKSFAELRAVLIKARIRAAREFFHAAAQPNPERQAEIAAANAAAAQKQQEAETRKRQLLAELKRERMVRHAAGDTREAYILCPRPPAPPAEPQRLAA